MEKFYEHLEKKGKENNNNNKNNIKMLNKFDNNKFKFKNSGFIFKAQEKKYYNQPNY